MMITLVNKKVVQPGIVSMNLDTGRTDLYTGQCHLSSQLELRLLPFRRPIPSWSGKVGVTNIPVFPGHPTASCAGGWQYVVNNYSNNLDLAIELAAFMGSPKGKVQDAQLGWTSAYLPAVYDTGYRGKKYPYYPLLGEQAKTERSRPKTPFWTTHVQRGGSRTGQCPHRHEVGPAGAQGRRRADGGHLPARSQ